MMLEKDLKHGSIGAIRIGSNDQFTWVDGTPLDYSFWSLLQPDNDQEEEFCVHLNLLFTIGLWNDYDCYSLKDDIKIMDFVCQHNSNS